jgi:hypothetical protein
MDSNLGKPGDRSSPGSRHIARQSPLSLKVCGKCNVLSKLPLERIEQAKEDWKSGRFAPVPGETEFIPLPES